jgi:hypothetical protein
MSKEIKNNASGCGCSGKTETAAEIKTGKKQISIEFLYLDLEGCDPCKASEKAVVSALEEVAAVVRATGAEITLEQIHVESLEQAVALGFQTSPTIRINGRDLQLDFKESHCRTCSELSGTETNCRVWNFQGKEHKSLPKEMLIEAVLREIFGGAAAESEPDKIVRDENALKNLQSFFESKSRAWQTTGIA